MRCEGRLGPEGGEGGLGVQWVRGFGREGVLEVEGSEGGLGIVEGERGLRVE